jgi:hypothetical protein
MSHACGLTRRQEKTQWVTERSTRDTPGTDAGCASYGDFRKVPERPKEQFINEPEASALVSRPMREPWHL